MVSRIPELPHDKTYHLFVCYEKNSVDFVEAIVHKLEDEGVKCCYFERDFTAGHSIIRMIYESIRKSLYMLVVLSEEFQDSLYCLNETEVAFNLKLKGEYDLIPIRIDNCSIPECLQHLVYIDVDDKDTIHTVIIETMSKKDLRTDLRQDRNGESFQIKLKRHKPNVLSFTRYTLDFTEKDRAEIWSNKFEVSADLLQEIEDTVNGSLLMNYGYICVVPVSVRFVLNIFLCLLIPLAIAYLILLIAISGQDEFVRGQIIAASVSMGIVAWIIVSLSCLGICRLTQFKKKGLFAVYLKICRLLWADLWEFSKQYKHQTGMIFFLAHGKFESLSCLTFHMMRYNFKPCENYFARRLDERKLLKKFCKENETNEEYTSRVFDKYLSQNSDKLEVASTTHRHTMKNSAKCVCLLVEDWLKTLENDQILR